MQERIRLSAMELSNITGFPYTVCDNVCAFDSLSVDVDTRVYQVSIGSRVCEPRYIGCLDEKQLKRLEKLENALK